MTVLHMDCVDGMRAFADATFDSIVCDPPYELGFMGKTWDSTGIANNVAMWREALRVLKPGGHLLAFSGSRTYHRMTCAIEDAGFEIRDQIMWLYGSGFPKSLDVSKAIDSRKDWSSLHALQGKVKIARESLGISQSEAARRMGLIAPDEKLAGGGFMWFETGMRVPTREQYPKLKAALNLDDGCDEAFEAAERVVIGQHESVTPGFTGMRFSSTSSDITTASTDAAKQWQGWGTALKPAHEPICVARKPLIGTVASNVLAFGTGAINIDASRIGSIGGCPATAAYTGGESINAFGKGLNDQCSPPVDNLGRWPANLIHDGSDDVLDAFDGPDRRDGSPGRRVTDQSPARFFYCAKASKTDRDEGNVHPTVKPTDLMRYLCRLVTPPGGLILDPFAGSGSTGKAAKLEGFLFIGFEQDAQYAAIANARIEGVTL